MKTEELKDENVAIKRKSSTAQLKKAFKNEKFDTTDDVSSTAPTTMLNEYLEAFDDDGWLISTAEKDGYKEIQSLGKTN